MYKKEVIFIKINLKLISMAHLAHKKITENATSKPKNTAKQCPLSIYLNVKENSVHFGK